MILIILSILWGWSITSDGHAIQIGEILTNNQNIKIMKMNFTSPVWLQSASNVGGAKEYISFVDTNGNPQIKLSCDGSLRIVSTYNGNKMIQKLSNISQQTVSIQSDPNTEIFIYGKVTSFDVNVLYPGGTTKISELNTLYAKSLTYLDCQYNQLTSLDVSANTALTYLDCQYNQLTSLDVSANTALTHLYCQYNQLTSLDVSANTALTHLYCHVNQLTSLDVSANTALTYLDCQSNQLTSLDVSVSTALTDFRCSSNQLTSLDVSANTALTHLYCQSNHLTSLDVSANTALTHLYCGNNFNITDIQSVAVNSDVVSSIVELIRYATSTTGTVTLRNGDEFNSTISDAAMEKGWDVQYFQ